MSAELDIVIPVYNEGANIGRVVDSLRRHVRTSFRILICYDHDDDDTLQALQCIDHREVDLQLVKNRRRGVLGAIRTGFDDSRARPFWFFPRTTTTMPHNLIAWSRSSAPAARSSRRADSFRAVA